MITFWSLIRKFFVCILVNRDFCISFHYRLIVRLAGEIMCKGREQKIGRRAGAV
jgi:hypothetical protein